MELNIRKMIDRRKRIDRAINTILRADTRASAMWQNVRRAYALADIADAVNDQPTSAVIGLLGSLSSDDAAEVFAELPLTRQVELLSAMAQPLAVSLLERMPSDERADLFAHLDLADRAELLSALPAEDRADILALGAYPEGSVGSATSSNFATVEPTITVAEALRQLRVTATDAETIYVIYVLDIDGRLVGAVSLRELVLADPGDLVSSLVRSDPIKITANAPREEAAELIRRYDLLAVPVVESTDDTMVGIVTVDDAMDIEKEEDAAQLARFGGTVGALGGPELDIRSSSLTTMFKTRVFWLALLTVFGIITSTYVANQEELLAQSIILAAFIAPIIDMGGNTGSQSATLVIRAMALGQVRLRLADVWFVLKREIPVALMLGVTIAILEAILAQASKGVGGTILLIVGLSMLACTILGGIVGVLLPFLARRIGTDPATLSAPMITSVMDLSGVAIYFAIAYAFLGPFS